ncbi:glycoside hydrolase family 20 protein [Bacteroides sp. UBA939]|uniref:glycoside hydrolase family 20 protein n=1 Tax=Bacteroides sp. UBA939 TaxID=1946092 RepID=UPI0025C379EA|nr:glycoside hydrolase family 20 protein [Bacteroides sp. UBA939]
MSKLNHALLAGIIALGCTSCSKKVEANFQVIPLPQEVNLSQETPFNLSANSQIVYPESNDLLKQNAEFLAEYIKQETGLTPTAKALADGEEAESGNIVLGLEPSIGNKEGYTLTITPENIFIKGQTESGVFYGIQTLRKSLPIVDTMVGSVLVPAGVIKDEPRFAYRGMHLDVGRHFFPLDFIKKYIDILALHNMNTFHWHLTEDQGWRIEIKKYPRLTEVGSIRNRTVIGRNTQEYDNTPYGGFYTQEQAKEIVKYAQDRYITVIPEVDLPGHMLAALAAYPELGCTGGPYEVCPLWGVFDDVLCVGNEKSMQFLEDVMSEIAEIFPSKYIHVGGDEAPRTRWKACPKCQALIKREGLKADKEHTAEDRIQSYCMARIEKFLNNKGRQIIGWDEILEGDVAPNATVMSWRGMEGGIKAAQLGHDVIMTPTDYCYFDYYQTTETQDEPLGIGGYVPIEKVYGMEPAPEVLTDEQKKHIIGAQANLWTEYIATTEHVEYMVLPRMAALAEVQWTQPEKKDYKNFITRLPHMMAIYDMNQYNYAKHVFNLDADFTPDTEKKAVVITLSTIDDAPIYYTLDGSEPTSFSLKYTEPIVIAKNADFRAVAIRPNGKSKETAKAFSFNKATYCPIELAFQPSNRYKFKGAITLVDGIKGNESYATGAWLGFVSNDVEATIDMGQATEIKQVATEAAVDLGAWIMGSAGIVVAVSDDNKEFREVAVKDFPAETNIGKKGIDNYEVTFDPVKARYVKVIIKRTPALPKGHAGEGRTPYLFIDEIAVE